MKDLKIHSALGFKKGFSLVELLVVMAIISVLLSVASVGIKNIGKAQGITSALSVSEGVFAQAQQLAKSQATTTRVIVHAQLQDEDQEERRRYRRLMLIVYKEVDPDTGRESQNWKIYGQPKLLPEKVYFSPELSRSDVRGVGGELSKQTFNLSREEGDEAECYYYEYNSQGICTTPGCTFVLESGARPRNSPRPKMGNTRNIGGFVLWRNGGTSRIQDLDRLEDQEN
ncbi:MAG: pilus assembly FimT family protein [Akkermansiaceae bacterium]